MGGYHGGCCVTASSTPRRHGRENSCSLLQPTGEYDSCLLVEADAITVQVEAEALSRQANRGPLSRYTKQLSQRAERFGHVQLWSMLDAVGAEPAKSWELLQEHAPLKGFAEYSSVDVSVELLLAAAEGSEALLLNALERLAKVMRGYPDKLAADVVLTKFYKSFWWTSAIEYFSELGTHHVMTVDTDLNDLDDRFAVLVLAYEMASASLDYSDKVAGSDWALSAYKCLLLLDVRTYARVSGLVLWRTARLAARLNDALAPRSGLWIQLVVGDSLAALRLAATYLGINAPQDQLVAALDSKVAGAGTMLATARQDLMSLWPQVVSSPESKLAWWNLCGLCAEQVSDLQCGLDAGVNVFFVEQAQPAWHSIPLNFDSGEVQPEFPGSLQLWEAAYGAEPSNIRSSAEGYVETVANYMRFQKVIAANPGRVVYMFPALAREDGYMPVPPGEKMVKICRRPLKVLPGEPFKVFRTSLDPSRSTKAFRNLVEAARETGAETLLPELLASTTDDAGVEREEVDHIRRYGTFLADALCVVLAARSKAARASLKKLRRLAVVSTSHVV